MIIEILIFIVTVLLATVFIKQKRVEKYYAERDVRIVPGVPLFGNFFKSTFSNRHFFEDLDHVYKAYPEERYVGVIESSSPIILIRDPELIKQITVKDFDHFVDHRPFFSEEHDPLFGGSLLMLKGDKWKDMRATLSPAFTGSKMRQMVPFIDSISQNIVNYLREDIKASIIGDVSSELKMDDLMRRYTNDVIANAAFGLEVNSLVDKENELYQCGRTLSTFTSWQRFSMFVILECPKLAKLLGMQVFPKKTTEHLSKIIIQTMKHREANNIERPDMIQLLMEAAKGTLKHSQVLDEDNVGFATTEESLVKHQGTIRRWKQNELIGQAFIFYFAGYESSASALTMTVHELALHPDVQDKLFKEIKQSHQGDKTMTYDKIQSLKYMDGVVNETFRKWSPALMLDRVCVRTYTLPPSRPGGKAYTLSPGDIVYNSVNSIHMDEKYYPDPHRFDPERFSEENKKNIQPFTFMPFGIGPRNCIASRFALLELKILMYYLILNFEIVKCERTTDPLRLQPMDFNIRALGGTWVQFKLRS